MSQRSQYGEEEHENNQIKCEWASNTNQIDLPKKKIRTFQLRHTQQYTDLFTQKNKNVV